MTIAGERLVLDIMTTDVIFVTPQTDVVEVARVLVNNGITGVPVVEDGRVVGILTDADIVSRETEVDSPAYFSFLDAVIRLPWNHTDEDFKRVLAMTAGELMSNHVVSIGRTATVQDAATLMFRERVNPLPVVDEDGALLGIISRTDIMRTMLETETSAR